MAVGPCIYNLFPSLAGSVRDWSGHLPRIAGMGFDWLFLNPIHATGFSGSLYAIKDPYRLNDRFQGGAPEPPDDLLRGFLTEARRQGLRVMLDLVVNHTAKDAALAALHPDWYRRDADGSLYSPRAVDPLDPSRVTIWGDLAELDYHNPAVRPGLTAWGQDYVRHYVELGVAGFRCDAACQVPAAVWRALIQAARAVAPETVFAAETLGCTVEQVEALRCVGFDYRFNNAKWWDFKASWALDQYNAIRTIAPSIAFPESHDTDRLAAEVGSQDTTRLKAHLKMRYLFSACFATGVMIPIGYEYGFTRKLDVVRTRPEDWETPRVDLSGFIAEVNALKASIPALNVEGPQRRITAPHNPVVGLLRLGDGGAGANANAGDCTVVLINPDEDRAHAIDPGPLLTETGGTHDGFDDVTPSSPRVDFVPGTTITLAPLELRVFHGKPDRRPAAAASGRAAATASVARLERLAGERITIEGVYPELDGGRFPVKRVVGDVLEVWADIFSDGVFTLGACLKVRPPGETAWREVGMSLFDNDRWVGRVPLTHAGRWTYALEAWRDLYESWRVDFLKKKNAGQDVALEIAEGRQFIERAAAAAEGAARAELEEVLARLHGLRDEALTDALLSDAVRLAMRHGGQRAYRSRYHNDLEVTVDRTAARYGAWYEIFPRSVPDTPGIDRVRGSGFEDVIRHVPEVQAMGFDVLYFPPIHPIGRSYRKGRNNSLEPGPDDPGSPYATGGEEGGHTAIHPDLGTLDDFRRLVAAARNCGIEIALDVAIQCSPDHPWIKSHPEWFYWRPDGSIRYAENPPKRYQDIVNVHFYSDAKPSLWYELRDVVLFWVDRGVTIFRVDNPHTKPFPFWEWMIREVQDRHPEVIFLAEAFTRPKLMKRLAKLGFTQSYTYFIWRNTKAELIEYLTELTQSEAREYLRPNFFANTPDINPYPLQNAGPAAYKTRAVLAATLSSVYGLYAPPYLLCEGAAVPGKEEYLNSEKYEIKSWDLNRPGTIRPYITQLNKIRRENPALHDLTNLRFYPAYDDAVLFYGKMTAARDNIILVAVNLDPAHARGGTVELPLHDLGLSDGASVEVEDLFTGGRFVWIGRYQHVWLDPMVNPCAIWRIAPPGQR